MCVPASTIDSELMPRPEFLWPFKLASSWPCLTPSLLSDPKTHRSEGPSHSPPRNAFLSSASSAWDRPHPHFRLCMCFPHSPSPVKVSLHTSSWSVLQTKSGLFSLFINKVLVEHSHTHLFMYCLLLLWCYIGRVKSLT